MSFNDISYGAFFDEMRKIAESEKSRGLEVAKVVGSGALGFGAGSAAGLGAGHIADLISEKMTGKRIPKSVVYGMSPLLGGAAGIAYAVHKAREQEAIRSALAHPSEPGAR